MRSYEVIPISIAAFNEIRVAMVGRDSTFMHAGEICMDGIAVIANPQAEPVPNEEERLP